MKLLKIGWIFILLVFIVTVIQFSLLKSLLQFGFTADDWMELFRYSILGNHLSFLDRYIKSLNSVGLYHTYQDMYLGFLVSLFKGNYLSYQVTGIILKILATLSLYPIVLALFKRKLLAFLTTLLFGISYSSIRALEYVCTGSDYLAIFFMNIFLLSYYYYFVTRKKILLFAATILLFLSFMSSPIRIYPLLAIVLLIEIFIWVKSRKLSGFPAPLIRLGLLFFPFYILFHFFPGALGGTLGSPLMIANLISDGNYQILLTPFAGFGYTFLTNDYWPVFGKLALDNFNNYFLFLLHGPVIIYSSLAILMGFCLQENLFFLSWGLY